MLEKGEGEAGSATCERVSTTVCSCSARARTTCRESAPNSSLVQNETEERRKAKSSRYSQLDLTTPDTMDLSFTLIGTGSGLMDRKREELSASSLASTTASSASGTTTSTSSSSATCLESHRCSSSQSSMSSLSSPVSLSTCHRCWCQRMSPNNRCHHRTQRKSKQLWPRGLREGLVTLLLLVCLTSPTHASMDITAFEYQRKFHKPLDLGECPQREIAVDMGNNTVYTEQLRCSLQQRGSITHLPRELSDSRNVLISSPGEIVAYLGLCGGEAASFLGILNSGDCVAVEVASRLTFNEKTVVRAFVGYYRKSLDILDSYEDNEVMEGLDMYYKDKFYLKNRSYGTLEIIFVQFRFRRARDAQRAKKLELSTPTMSTYMREVEKTIGTPRKVVVINLSTATQETYDIKHFKNDQWNRAIRHVQILELNVQRVREKIDNNVIKPHLQYQLFPFLDTGDKSFRLSNPIPWEKISMLEVQLRQAIDLAKKTSRKCRGNKTKLCRRVRELRRKLISAHAEIHKRRSNWVSLTPDEKNTFATKYTSMVKSYSSVTKRLAKSVREMRRQAKLERLRRKQNKANQIPLHSSERLERRYRRIRHSRGRSKVRKG